MSETASVEAETPKKKMGIFLPLLVAFLLGAAGFASTYLGIWSPRTLLQTGERASAADRVVFIDIPTIEIAMPGGRGRSVVMTVALESTAQERSKIEAQLPRIQDVMNGFLSEIDPSAYDKRGVLDILRAELMTRIGNVLDGARIADLLITEFRIK